MKDYVANSKLKRKSCKCTDYKRHDKYCVLNELPIPENVADEIYGSAHRCIRCENNIKVAERLQRVVVWEGFHQYHVDKFIFSIKRTFLSYETVKNMIKNIS